MIENNWIVNQCFDNKDCVELCSNYSLTSFNSIFYGNVKFYWILLEKFEKFKNWVENKEKEVPDDLEEEEELDKKWILSVKSLKKKIKKYKRMLRDNKKTQKLHKSRSLK